MALWVQVLLVMITMVIEAIVLIHHFTGAYFNYKNHENATFYNVVFAGQICFMEALEECHFTLFGQVIMCLLYTAFAFPGNVFWLILFTLRRLFIKKGY